MLKNQKSSPLSAAAYVYNNQLCIVGAYDSPLGTQPFRCEIPLEESLPDGPVIFGEDLHPELEKALEKSQETIMATVATQNMKKGAEDLVVRARSGDQVAMSILQEIGKRAKAGDEKAKHAVVLVKDFIKAHPPGITYVPSKVRDFFSHLKGAIKSLNPYEYATSLLTLIPRQKDLYATSLALANGPDLNKGGPANPRIRSLIASYPTGGEREVFKAAMMNQQKTCDQYPEACKTGKAVGLAKRIQAVRKGAPISSLFRKAGWELGE